MIIFPAIDLFGGQAVRLYKGSYEKMTVYDPEPLHTALAFEAAGATHLHLVDLEGARLGHTSNLPVIQRILSNTKLFTQVGGGIRNMETVEQYLRLGVDRVILGTAAVTDEAFLTEAVAQFGEKIAVGVDLKDGMVAIKGWTECSAYTCDDFCKKLQNLGVRTMICTDISRDGAMAGTNLELYQTLSRQYDIDVIASGGVSSLADVQGLRAMGLYGAIIGKACYTGAIHLNEAIEAAL